VQGLSYDTFRKVLDVLSEWMVKREELTMFVERRILVTLLQPNEPQMLLVYWAWELPINTPGADSDENRQKWTEKSYFYFHFYIF
jgi:hypothetical protein